MSVGVEGAEQAVRFVVGAGGEKERLTRSSTAVVPEFKAPQPIDDDRSSGGFGQRAKGVAVRWIERIDLAVTEISDQQLAGGHVTEASRRRERHAPSEASDSGETRNKRASQATLALTNVSRHFSPACISCKSMKTSSLDQPFSSSQRWNASAWMLSLLVWEMNRRGKAGPPSRANNGERQ